MVWDKTSVVGESGGALIPSVIVTFREAIVFSQGLALIVYGFAFVAKYFDSEVAWKIISKQKHLIIVSHLGAWKFDGQS